MIGAIGSKSIDDVIVFEVSSDKIFTIDNFTRTNNVRFSKNDVLLKKPVSEFIGADLDNINFKITLKAQNNVNPREEMNKLIELQRSGTSVSLVLGKVAFGVYRWRIVNLTMDWERIDNKGVCIEATCDVALEEYV
jgi:phage protein U